MRGQGTSHLPTRSPGGHLRAGSVQALAPLASSRGGPSGQGLASLSPATVSQDPGSRLLAHSSVLPPYAPVGQGLPPSGSDKLRHNLPDGTQLGTIPAGGAL